MITKSSSGSFIVKDKYGKKKLGKHKTKKKALVQLAAIEISKKRRGKK